TQLGTGAAVNAPNRYLARRAAIDLVGPAAVGRHRDWFEIAGQRGYSVGLDKRVEHEGASRLPLAIPAMTAMHAIPAMTAMHEQRCRDELIAHRPTSERHGHYSGTRPHRTPTCRILTRGRCMTTI